MFFCYIFQKIEFFFFILMLLVFFNITFVIVT